MVNNHGSPCGNESIPILIKSICWFNLIEISLIDSSNLIWYSSPSLPIMSAIFFVQSEVGFEFKSTYASSRDYALPVGGDYIKPLSDNCRIEISIFLIESDMSWEWKIEHGEVVQAWVCSK